MLNLVKSNSVTGLEKQLADKQAKLAQLRTQFGEVRQRAGELGDLVAAALVDDAANLASLEGQLHAAESRLRSTRAAIAKVEAEVADLERRLAAEKDRVAREASASRCRQLAKELEKLKPAAAEATRKVAELAGSLPANGALSTMTVQAVEHWVGGSAAFFDGDFIDVAVKELRQHADEIVAGERPHVLGPSYDEQAAAYGKKPMVTKAA